MYTFLVTLDSFVTNMSVQFVNSCRPKCTFVPCCLVRLLFDFTCYFIAPWTNKWMIEWMSNITAWQSYSSKQNDFVLSSTMHWRTMYNDCLVFLCWIYACCILTCLLVYVFTFLLFRIVLSVFCVSQSSSCYKTLINVQFKPVSVTLC